jgi:PAS domain S-box-containing protein
MARVLVVDDEVSIRETLGEFLAAEGHVVATAETVGEATALLAREEQDVVVTDIILPQATGLDLLRQVQGIAPGVKVVLITGEPSYESAAAAVRHGAFDYLPKPVTQQAITRVVSAAMQLKGAEDENRRYRERLEELVEERTRQIEEYTERLRRVADQTRAFARCGEIRDLAPRILSVLAHDMGAEGGSFYLREEDCLVLVASLDSEHQARSIELPATPGSVMARALATRDGIVVRDIAQQAEVHPSGWNGYRDGSLLALPCVDAGGEVHGILTLHDKHQPPFGLEDLEIGRIVAAHAVEAIRAIELNRRLRASEREYRDLAEHSLTGILLLDDGHVVYANARVLQNLGIEDGEELLGGLATGFVHEGDRAEAAERLGNIMSGKERWGQQELRFVRRDGTVAWIEALGVRVERGGRPLVLINTIDITARKRAEEERKQIEARYLQAQKMEAVGRLAGGVAHDFNNVLTAIVGYAEFLLSELGEGHPNREDVMEIRQAADRASTLTRQLLAFSRRQIREPRPVDVNEVIDLSRKMLGRMIGEDVALRFRPGAKLHAVRADPRELEQILFNLATNARDAMPTGGALTITTADGPGDADGEWVEVRVEDDGCGMDAETSSQAFEPFFTTKDRGTGLGLATVRDIVAQDGGAISLESTPGGGTRVTIRLPALGRTGVDEEAVRQTEGEVPHGDETILLVEDDAAVRQVTRAMLASAGYQVLEARDAGEGLRLAGEHAGRIDLLLSDVVLPGKNGPTLLEELRQLRPDLRHLFVSGYAEDVIAKHGVVRAGVRLLEKPFGPGVLARAVRAALDDAPPEG